MQRTRPGGGTEDKIAFDGIRATADAMRAVLETVEQPFATNCLTAWPPETPVRSLPQPRTLPVLSYLPAALQAAPARHHRLATALAASADKLAWAQTYTKEELGQAFLDRYGWTCVVSAAGPIAVPGLLAAFLVLGPDIEYPRHRHPAEEGYLILSGEASWSVGDEEWRVQPPGTFIHNPPWQPHGIRTDRGQPLLAMVLWSNDTPEKSSFADTSAL